MSKGRVFRFRYSDEEAELLQGEADERGLTKADRIRDALGWPLADRQTLSNPGPPPHRRPPSRSSSGRPDLAAIQLIANKLGGTPLKRHDEKTEG